MTVLVRRRCGGLLTVGRHYNDVRGRPNRQTVPTAFSVRSRRPHRRHGGVSGRRSPRRTESSPAEPKPERPEEPSAGNQDDARGAIYKRGLDEANQPPEGDCALRPGPAVYRRGHMTYNGRARISGPSVWLISHSGSSQANQEQYQRDAAQNAAYRVKTPPSSQKFGRSRVTRIE